MEKGRDIMTEDAPDSEDRQDEDVDLEVEDEVQKRAEGEMMMKDEIDLSTAI